MKERAKGMNYNDLTGVEKDQITFSDLHKDAHGTRPSSERLRKFGVLSEHERRQEIKSLGEYLEDVLAEEAEEDRRIREEERKYLQAHGATPTMSVAFERAFDDGYAGNP